MTTKCEKRSNVPLCHQKRHHGQANGLHCVITRWENTVQIPIGRTITRSCSTFTPKRWQSYPIYGDRVQSKLELSLRQAYTTLLNTLSTELGTMKESKNPSHRSLRVSVEITWLTQSGTKTRSFEPMWFRTSEN